MSHASRLKINYMNFIRLLFLLFILAVFGCHHDASNSTRRSEHIKSRKNVIGKDTLLIDHKTALFVLLDTIELEKRRKTDSDAFNAYSEDGAYYDYVADSVLTEKKLPIIHAANYKYLKFLQKNGKITVVKIDTLPQLSTLYFFDPASPPYIVDGIDIEDEYKRFYHARQTD